MENNSDYYRGKYNDILNELVNSYIKEETEKNPELAMTFKSTAPAIAESFIPKARAKFYSKYGFDIENVEIYVNKR